MPKYQNNTIEKSPKVQNISLEANNFKNPNIENYTIKSEFIYMTPKVAKINKCIPSTPKKQKPENQNEEEIVLKCKNLFDIFELYAD